MATQVAASANNRRSTITLTFNDASGLLTNIAWNNPTGVWTILFTKNASEVLARVLNPGDSGSQNIPQGRAMHIATALHGGNDFGFTTSWVG
jgi:hypothetical protein